MTRTNQKARRRSKLKKPVQEASTAKSNTKVKQETKKRKRNGNDNQNTDNVKKRKPDKQTKQVKKEEIKKKRKNKRKLKRVKKMAQSKEQSDQPIVISDDDDNDNDDDDDDDDDNSLLDSSNTLDKPIEISDDESEVEEGELQDDQVIVSPESRQDMEEDYIALGSDENDKSGQLDEDERPYHYPWWEQTTDNTMASFQAEIEDFVNFLQPTQEEINIRHYLIHKIRYHIRQRWSDAKVHVFGSFKTNTFLPDSDMDLMVELPGYPTSSDLYTVASVLYQAKVSKRYPTVIGKATVPVVKFEERLTGLKVDIILNSFGGVDCATYVSRKLSEYPGARQLTLIIKHIVALREVNEVYTGGIGGFGVVCMVISFLQMHPMVASGTIDPQKNLGTLLLDFLQLYGIHFAVGKVAISVSHKGKYYPKMTNCLRQGKPVFSIEDPLDAKNDIGVKSFNALTVVKVFRRAYVDMTNRAYAMLRSTQPKKECLLTYIGYIPESMIQQRNIIAQAYDEQLWQDDPAADSFVWPT